MRCPSCGALYGDGLEDGAEPENVATEEIVASEPACHFYQDESSQSDGEDESYEPEKPASRLIAFPGVSRSSLPSWRKELSERVREVQEKRAREAALEAAEVQSGANDGSLEALPQLELLPQAGALPVNPMVAAALRRIERAHTPIVPSANRSTNRALATAVACEPMVGFSEEAWPVSEATPAEAFATTTVPEPDWVAVEEKPQADKTYNLIIVPAPTISAPERVEVKTNPRRVIDDLNPALNYLDSISTAVPVEDISHNQAPAFRRLLSAAIDLLFVVFLSSPFAAAVELADANWRDTRVIGFAAGTLVLVTFLYLMFCTAFAGRTLGMRLLSLRVVDVRTGLIPTGSQSAGRALIYVVSLLSAGIALIFAVLDSERRTAHDRFTRTTVIRV